MELFELLAGKYSHQEQVAPGPVQTFKARNSATGRPVYIHRVSTTEEQQQQSALLLLLATAMTRSESVKRLVLDVADEKGFWYVVTECEPQCLQLREWLQFEIDSAAGKAPTAAPKSPDPLRLPAESAKLPDPGEFTRMFLKQPLRPSSPAAPPPTATPAPAAKEPGEFTRMFQSPLAQPPQEPIVPTAPPERPSQAGPSQAGPGEFTQFFREGLPAGPPKPSSSPELQRTQMRPSVQRPNTPVPPFTPRASAGPGEFTRMFSTPSAAPPSTPSVPDIFNLKPEAPAPMQSKSQEPGEYTRLFGKGEAPAAPKQATVAPAPQAPILDDALKATRQVPAYPQTPPPPAPVKKPSEFTMMMQGAAPAAPAVPTLKPLPAVSMPAMPAMPTAPAPAAVKLPAATAAPSPNKKLYIFLAILAVLAIVLVVLVVLLVKK